MYYYKLDATTSQRINQMNNLVNDYERMVVDWLSFNFNFNEDTSYEVFNDIPVFTKDIVELNPELKPLLKKYNYAFNQRNHDSRHYIYSWKAKKMDNGYKYRECYTDEEYKMLLYSIFGTVENIEIVSTNKFAYMKTDIQHPYYIPITPSTYERHAKSSTFRT